VIAPPPSRGRRRGFAEHCSAPPQPARDAARAVEGVGGEGAIVAHEFVKSLRKHMARAVSLLCWLLRGHGRPLSPNPSPARGEGSISVQGIPNTFIHTRESSTRPMIAWRAAAGVSSYRLQLVSREPEGRTLASIDSLVNDTRFVPPQALSRRFGAGQRECDEPVPGGVAPPAPSPAREHRFLIDARSACAVSGLTLDSLDAGEKRIRWAPTPAAGGYEIFSLRGDRRQAAFPAGDERTHRRDAERSSQVPCSSPFALAAAMCSDTSATSPTDRRDAPAHRLPGGGHGQGCARSRVDRPGGRVASPSSLSLRK
jgi:hypothetical protein